MRRPDATSSRVTRIERQIVLIPRGQNRKKIAFVMYLPEREVQERAPTDEVWRSVATSRTPSAHLLKQRRVHR